MKKTRVNKRDVVYEGRIFKLVKENITLENGISTDLDIIRHPGAAAIVPAYGYDKIVLVKQYRHAIGEYIWEIPAGTFDGNEDPLECAKRELAEETGYSADFWEKLGEITPVPAYSDEKIHVYFAANLVKEKQNLDEDEILHVHTLRVPDVLEMIQRGEIRDSKTIASLFMATLWMKNKLKRTMDELNKKNS
ncbi:MAG: ADP-ribose pyrophosphatase [Deltaproteobacteria bacterium]|nr:MAG: ADP-ribose pyrophosphatase [Deltaproteobacteria bacterium]